MTEPLKLLLIGIGLTLYALYTLWQSRHSGDVSLRYGRFAREDHPVRYRLGMIGNILCALIGVGLIFAATYVQIYGETL